MKYARSEETIDLFMTTQTLHDELSTLVKYGTIKKEVPPYLSANLSKHIGKREYQLEAFARFAFWWDSTELRKKPAQLLFHMATGSGKTVVMAGLILDLYVKGYRNFIFFVNNTNIINKTKENFLNHLSIKYLFAPQISISDKQVFINSVENFQANSDKDINIVFTTIQALHTRLNNPKENSLTYEDFDDCKVVLISDEAHHINTETKKRDKLTKEEFEELNSWEKTVNKIFQSNIDNVLLEFTATADFYNDKIWEKYFDKLIFDYPLKQFRKDGYSKEVKILQADLRKPIDRAMQAIILSQYRKKVFEEYKLDIKPVVMFKSNYVNPPKTRNENTIVSSEFWEEFMRKIKTLNVNDVRKLRANSITAEPIRNAFKYFDSKSITDENLILELKEDFAEEKCISIDTNDDSIEKQIAINTLEDKTNPYRVVFAVEKLNEGWDVLNLFDIVRLYNKRDAKGNKPGGTTTKEAQLIGRGARYCPFQIANDQPIYQRKYDKDIKHPLRICEELYYHSMHNVRYIQELNIALEEIGILGKETKPVSIKLKESFVESKFFKNGLIFLNEKIRNDRLDSNKLNIGTLTGSYQLETGISKVTTVYESAIPTQIEKAKRKLKLIDFGVTILRKALSSLEFYEFSNLMKYYPHLKSISQFIQDENYLKNIVLEIEGSKDDIRNLSAENSLKAAIWVLEKISIEISKGHYEYRGSNVFKPHCIKEIFTEKVLNFVIDNDTDRQYGIAMSQTPNEEFYLDLSDKDWYVYQDNYGTSEEKLLIKFINNIYDLLKVKYNCVYLLRSERFFKIFNFSDGRAVEPDFVLYLEHKNPKNSVIYQLFIEPKGDIYKKADQWKEDFLLEIGKNAKIDVLFESKDYKISGLPFYSKSSENSFSKEFEKNLL